MTISIFDLFSIGIGPSSSHTVGPMLAAFDFASRLKEKALLSQISRVEIHLFGSLALTGKGHGTDKAILNGLEGKEPHNCNALSLEPRVEEIIKLRTLVLAGTHQIEFDVTRDYHSHKDIFLEKHSNALKFIAYHENETIDSEIYFSIGGGFIVTEENFGKVDAAAHDVSIPYPFESADELLQICQKQNISIAKLMLENEKAFLSEKEVIAGILRIASVMDECIDNGLNAKGILPGGLNVKRRAGELYQKLQSQEGIKSVHENADVMNWLNAFAMAVNEENAAGHRVVTAPTNGAAGIIPAVMRYYNTLVHSASEAGLIDYFLTAAAIGILYKKNASISGAEVGCQGEVGVASSMAAAGLTAAIGGSNVQIENAAEIAMEHHLGMTCDPIMGLVQIPCIERNAMGAVKAVNASRMALVGDGQHKVPLDKVIKTMKQTGHDMMTIYKETSQGGLAVNVPEC